jgi:hypothetical protein
MKNNRTRTRGRPHEARLAQVGQQLTFFGFFRCPIL